MSEDLMRTFTVQFECSVTADSVARAVEYAISDMTDPTLEMQWRVTDHDRERQYITTTPEVNRDIDDDEIEQPWSDTRGADEQLADTVSDMPEDMLADIASDALQAGSLWRPHIKTEERPDGSWTWFDRQDDVAQRFGSFANKGAALLAGILAAGIDEEEI